MGSEMCIRDRSNGVLRFKALVWVFYVLSLSYKVSALAHVSLNFAPPIVTKQSLKIIKNDGFYLFLFSTEERYRCTGGMREP